MKNLLLVLVLGTGCDVVSENPYLSPFVPTISFENLQVNYVDFQEVDTEFVFTIDNPNPVGINIDEFSYALRFSDVEWVNGNDPDGLLLNAAGASTVSLPTHIVFLDLYEMVQASRGLDSLPFRLDGDFGLRMDESVVVTEGETAEEDPEADVLQLPYDVDGDFPALRRPQFSLQRLRVADYSWDQLALELILDVDNEHASNLIFQRFSYDVDLGNGSLISGTVDNLEEIIHGVQSGEGSPNRELRIPIELNTISAVANAWSILSGGGGVQLGFSAVSDVDTPFGLVELVLDETGRVDVELQ